MALDALNKAYDGLKNTVNDVNAAATDKQSKFNWYRLCLDQYKDIVNKYRKEVDELNYVSKKNANNAVKVKKDMFDTIYKHSQGIDTIQSGEEIYRILLQATPASKKKKLNAEIDNIRRELMCDLSQIETIEQQPVQSPLASSPIQQVVGRPPKGDRMSRLAGQSMQTWMHPHGVQSTPTKSPGATPPESRDTTPYGSPTDSGLLMASI